MATIDYKQLATPEANLIELLSAQNQDGTYTAKLMGSEPFAVLAAKTIYNAYNDIEDNMAADVEGPASSTDNALARFDGTTGKLLQNSNAILTDAGALSLASNLTVSGTGTTGGNLRVRNALGYATGIHTGTTSDSTQQLLLSSNAAYNHAYISKGSTTLGIGFSSDNGSFVADDSITITAATKLVTLTGNLTVSGSITALSSRLNFTDDGTNINAIATSRVLQLVATGSSVQMGYNTDIYFANNTSVFKYGGNLLLGTTTDVGGRLTVSKGSQSASSSTSTSGLVVGDIANTTGVLELGLNTTYLAYIQSRDRSSASYYALNLNPAGGNVLIGTTTDSGNGKLQLATHTTSAGGIGFGTATSLYTESAGTLSLNNSAGDARLYFYNTGVAQGKIESASSNFYVTASAGSLILRSGGPVTALTLDSSQNATFAKNVTASGGTALFQATNANSIVHIKVNSDTYNPYIRLEGYDRSIYLGVKDAGADGTFNISTAAALTSPMLSLDPATNGATFAGAIAIGNTVQTAAAVASTHKVTISIGGVTYYLLATNV